MKIQFDWRKFEDEKPEIGKMIIIIKGMEHVSDKNLWIGDFSGIRTGVRGDTFNFLGKEFSPKSLRLQKILSYTIYSPEQYINGYNPYDFYWDYYNINWTK